jgi:DNA processing protein
VGPATFQSLIARFGSATAALAALPALSRKGGLVRPLRICPEDAADAELERAAEIGAHAVALGEPDYPDMLRHIPAAPPLVWIRGRADLAAGSVVAVVGSRNASAVGLKFTRRIAGEIGSAGHAVASGLARGIDTAAHEASLSTGTIAVVAGGIDVIYPPENERLQAAIGEQGLLVSEMKPGTVPNAEHFPRRNRLISGIARAVIVVEAAMRSGSLITARYAAEQGREVLAVPGSPLDPRAEGTNRLIREGATLFTAASDVLEVLARHVETRSPGFTEVREETSDDRPEPAGGERERLDELLSPSPVDMDDLVRESGLPPAVVAAIVLEFEIAGRVTRHPGGGISRTTI